MADENEVIMLEEDQNEETATPSAQGKDIEDDIEEVESTSEGMSKEMLEEQRQLAEAMRLPQAPIDRIVKEVLPPGMHASKETRAIFSRAVSVFIICLGTAAHDSAVASKRKGILEKDVSAALKKMHLNIPEIVTLLANFKANNERLKQQKQQERAAAVQNDSLVADPTDVNEPDANAETIDGEAPNTGMDNEESVNE